MDLKKNPSLILKCLCILLLILLVVPLSYIFRNRGYNRENIIGLYAEQVDSLDLVYVGGSACFVYWEPLRAWHKYGFTSYDFAHDTISPVAIKYYMEEVKKTQHPKLWVIDMRPFQYGDGPILNSEQDKWTMYGEVPIRNGADGLSYSRNRNKLIDSIVINENNRKYYYFDILKYHSRWPGVLREIGHSVKAFDKDIFYFAINRKPNNYKGFYFVPKTKPVSFEELKNIKEEKRLAPEIDGVFRDLLDYCQKNNDKMLFVVHSYCQQEEHKQKYNYMQRVIKEYGFDFINMNDYSDEMGIDYDLDMYNENHVNVFGAEKYTDFLAKYIKEHYDLPDRRQDPNFADWNDLYAAFEEKSQSVKKEILQKKGQQ